MKIGVDDLVRRHEEEPPEDVWPETRKAVTLRVDVEVVQLLDRLAERWKQPRTPTGEELLTAAVWQAAIQVFSEAGVRGLLYSDDADAFRRACLDARAIGDYEAQNGAGKEEPGGQVQEQAGGDGGAVVAMARGKRGA